MPKTSEKLSLPKTKTIHGVEIKKMPCGKYFEALQTLKDLPEDFIKELTDNGQEFKLSELLTSENMIKAVTRLMIILPDFTFSFLSRLMDIDEDKIRNELTPKELVDVVKEFWQLNELESFFDQMKSAMDKLITVFGFKKQLPSALNLESVKESF